MRTLLATALMIVLGMASCNSERQSDSSLAQSKEETLHNGRYIRVIRINIEGKPYLIFRDSHSGDITVEREVKDE